MSQNLCFYHKLSVSVATLRNSDEIIQNPIKFVHQNTNCPLPPVPALTIFSDPVHKVLFALVSNSKISTIFNSLMCMYTIKVNVILFAGMAGNQISRNVVVFVAANEWKCCRASCFTFFSKVWKMGERSGTFLNFIYLGHFLLCLVKLLFQLGPNF